MRMPGFEPGSSGPKPLMLTKLHHILSMICCFYPLNKSYLFFNKDNRNIFKRGLSSELKCSLDKNGEEKERKCWKIWCTIWCKT